MEEEEEEWVAEVVEEVVEEEEDLTRTLPPHCDPPLRRAVRGS